MKILTNTDTQMFSGVYNIKQVWVTLTCSMCEMYTVSFLHCVAISIRMYVNLLCKYRNNLPVTHLEYLSHE